MKHIQNRILFGTGRIKLYFIAAASPNTEVQNIISKAQRERASIKIVVSNL